MLEALLSFTRSFQEPQEASLFPSFQSSPRMMFALREQLEQEGLGNSPQAINLERAFIYNREYILEELGPLFRQMDKSHVERTDNPRFWWWNLDDSRVVAAEAGRLGLLADPE